MTFSSLISRTVPHSGKYSSRQGRPVVRCIPHHWAGLSGGDTHLINPNTQASVHYFIYTNGEIVGMVPEEFRAWTTGVFEADVDSITFEVQDATGQVNGNDDDPNSWQITEASLRSVIMLIADIASRHGWGAVAIPNVRGHREFVQTSCPGGYFWRQFHRVRNDAHALLTGGLPTAPSLPPTTDKSVWQLADEVMAGLHGSGEARRASLGSQYDAVQAEVNRRFGLSGPSQPIPSESKSIAQLVDEVLAGAHGNGEERQRSLGSNYEAVQNEINRRLGGGGVAPQGVNIAQLADAVIRGDYGSGQDRINALGSNYDAVQQEVNRRLGGGTAIVSSPVANISALADAVMRGEFGNGEQRQAALGANYDAVQAEVNRRFS